jgi:heme exporter protein D
VNHWLELGKIPVLVFSGAFIVGYFAIWAIIYTIIKRKTAKLNEMLKQKQREQA